MFIAILLRILKNEKQVQIKMGMTLIIHLFKKKKNLLWLPPSWYTSVLCWNYESSRTLSFSCRLKADRCTDKKGTVLQMKRWSLHKKNGSVHLGKVYRWTLKEAVLERILEKLTFSWSSDPGRGQEQFCRLNTRAVLSSEAPDLGYLCVFSSLQASL